MKKILLVFLILSNLAFANETLESKYFLHSLVPQSVDSFGKKAIEFWVNFLYESDDSLRANYWDSNERKYLKKDYCLFEKLLFQMPKEFILETFPPFIMSAEKFGNDYLIKTLFSESDFSISDTASKNQNPIAIIEVFVSHTNGKYQIRNIIDFESLAYKDFKSGNIHYKVHPLLAIDTIACQNANKFCDSLSLLWNGYKLNERIKYYVTSGTASLGKLLGFDFAYFGITYGYTLIDAKYIFSGIKDFNYKHELSHLIIGTIQNHLLSEGIATYFGGSLFKSFDEMKINFAKTNIQLSKAKVDEILKIKNSNNYYVLGAILVSEIIKKSGMQSLKSLSKKSFDDEVMIKEIADILGVETKNLPEYLNKILKEYQINMK